MNETSLAEKELILLSAGYQWRNVSQYGESFIECKNPLHNWQDVVICEDMQEPSEIEFAAAIDMMWTHYEAQL